MYAIIKTGGKQYRAEVGTRLRVEKLEAKEGEQVKLEVIMVVKDSVTTTGNKSNSVSARVIEHGKGEKIDIFKYKPKKNYRRRQGHRQPFTLIEITEVA